MEPWKVSLSHSVTDAVCRGFQCSVRRNAGNVHRYRCCWLASYARFSLQLETIMLGVCDVDRVYIHSMCWWNPNSLVARLGTVQTSVTTFSGGWAACVHVQTMCTVICTLERIYVNMISFIRSLCKNDTVSQQRGRTSACVSTCNNCKCKVSIPRATAI